MLENTINDLDKILFYLRSHNISHTYEICLKTRDRLEKIRGYSELSGDASKVYSKLVDDLDVLKKCVSKSRPGIANACRKEAYNVYKDAVLLLAIVTGEIRELVKARRAGYLAIAMGLPTAALFGLSPMAIALIFIGVLWTYFHFVRLRLIGWVTLTITLFLISPFLINSIRYFFHALLDPGEIEYIANELSIGYTGALIMTITLLAISLTAFTLSLYSLIKLFKYRVLFH
ncbi:MAG: hypothetical protein QXU22_03875 [Desulfurococcaceae archaeon]